MAFVWVQQWIAQPIVVEEPMGDLPASSAGSQSFESLRAGFSQDEVQADTKTSTLAATNPSSSSLGNSTINAPFYSQFSSLPASQSHSRTHIQHGNTPYNSSPRQGIDPSSFHMSAIAGALPEHSSAQSHPQMLQGQGGVARASTSGLGYQFQQMSHFPNQSSSSYHGQTPYALGFTQNHYPNYASSQGPQQTPYQPFNPSSPRMAGPNPLNVPYPNYPQPPSQYLYYASPYGPQGSYSQAGAAQPAHQPIAYNRRASLPSGHNIVMEQNMNSATLSGSYSSASRLDTGVNPGEFSSSVGVQGKTR
jgi:hypothetical protein